MSLKNTEKLLKDMNIDKAAGIDSLSWNKYPSKTNLQNM